MDLQTLISKIAEKYSITEEDLLNTRSHRFIIPRRDLAHQAIAKGFTYYALERATNIPRATWNNSHHTPIDVEKAQALQSELCSEKQAKEILERKKIAAEFKGGTITKNVLGFIITELDEIKYRRAINASKEFMLSYGKGMEPSEFPCGRIIAKHSWYI